MTRPDYRIRWWMVLLAAPTILYLAAVARDSLQERARVEKACASMGGEMITTLSTRERLCIHR